MLAKPEIDDGIAWYLAAFWDLNGDRQLGAMGGAGPISFLALDRYAERQGVTDADDFARFSTIIRGLDGVFLKHLTEKAKRPKEKRRGKR